MACSKEEPDWTNLPKPVIDLIAEKLIHSPSQYVRLGAVCKTWRAVNMENRQLRCKVLKGCHRQVPFLMIPTKDKSQERRGLFNIIEKKSYGLELPVPYNRRCSGCSYGWIATVDDTLAVRLINPFTGGIINLPSVDTAYLETTEDENYEIYVKKVILSDDPYVNPDNYMVLALVGAWRELAVIRPGDKTWTYTRSNLEKIVKEDVIFVKGKIYAVNWRHGIISVDVASIKASSSASASAFEEQMVIAAKHDDHRLGYSLAYIVESSDGDILIVQRFCTTWEADDIDHSLYHVTRGFKVFKLERHLDEARLVEVKNIGDDALFLGDNHSMSVVASQFPGCRSNSIYFTDDNIDFGPHLADGRHDMGTFNLENGCLERYYDLDPSHKDMPPPFFILPTLGAYFSELC